MGDAALLRLRRLPGLNARTFFLEVPLVKQTREMRDEVVYRATPPRFFRSATRFYRGIGATKRFFTTNEGKVYDIDEQKWIGFLPPIWKKEDRDMIRTSTSNAFYWFQKTNHGTSDRIGEVSRESLQTMITDAKDQKPRSDIERTIRSYGGVPKALIEDEVNELEKAKKLNFTDDDATKRFVDELMKEIGPPEAGEKAEEKAKEEAVREAEEKPDPSTDQRPRVLRPFTSPISPLPPPGGQVGARALKTWRPGAGIGVE